MLERRDGARKTPKVGKFDMAQTGRGAGQSASSQAQEVRGAFCMFIQGFRVGTVDRGA